MLPEKRSAGQRAGWQENRDFPSSHIFPHYNLSHRRPPPKTKNQVSTMASAGLGVPVKLLHESLGHIITVELKTGQLYRGKLAEGM